MQNGAPAAHALPAVAPCRSRGASKCSPARAAIRRVRERKPIRQGTRRQAKRLGSFAVWLRKLTASRSHLDRPLRGHIWIDRFAVTSESTASRSQPKKVRCLLSQEVSAILERVP